MKILYLSQAGAVGGAERVLLDLIAPIRALHPAWQCMLIAPAAGELVDEAHKLEIKTRVIAFPDALATLGDAEGGADGITSRLNRWRTLGRLGVSSPAIVAYIRRLARVIAEFEPDVIHANGFKMHLLGARAASGAPALLWHLHDFVCARPLIGPLLRMNRGRCAMLVANSQSVADDARSGLRDGLPIRTIYNGVDLRRFASDGSTIDLDSLSGLEQPDRAVTRVGLIATAARWKGHEVFLRALAALPARLNVRGYIVGGPIYQTTGSQYTMTELHAMANSVGLAGKVGFTGHLEDIPAVMRSLDSVVHASVKPEPFGLVVVEAMASQRAVIVSASGGVAELIDHGVNALAYRPGDTDGLARAIEAVASDPALRHRLGVQGRLTAEQRFDRTRMGAEFASLYASLAPRLKDDGLAASAYS